MAVDPELIGLFVEESQEIVAALGVIVDNLENSDPKDTEQFAVFAQRIDSIMGCAKTIGVGPDSSPAFKNIGVIAEGCKWLGYKAWQVKEPDMQNLITAFLADALEVTSASLDTLKDPTMVIDQADFQKVSERLKWLSEKVVVSPEAQAAINKRFGMD